MSGPFPGAGSNPPAGGSGANPSAANPPAGGQSNQPPAQSGNNGAPGSNPPAGGSGNAQSQHQQQQGNPQQPGAQNLPQQGQDDNNPIAADVYREKLRENQSLRKRLEQLEAAQRARDEAQLSESERKDRRLAEYEQKETAWQTERQTWLIDKAIEEVARGKNLASTSAVRAIMMAEFSELLGYDESGRPSNMAYVVDQVITKYPFLAQQSGNQPPSQPASGRPVAPPRAGNGQYAPQSQGQGQAPQRPNASAPQYADQQGYTPPSQWKRLSDLTPEEWTRNKNNNNR